jgi:outer membrane protein TolC
MSYTGYNMLIKNKPSLGRFTIKLQTVVLTLVLMALFTKLNAQSLEEYLQMAAQNNPEVHVAYLQFEAAMQKVPQVKALPDPTVTMSAFGQMIETRIGRQEAKFSLMQMFPWFGTLSIRENAATLMAEAAFQNYLDIRNDLFLRVKEAYAELYELHHTLHLEEENLSILNTYRELSLNKFSNGKGTMVDVVRIDIGINESHTNIQVLRDREVPLQVSFNSLLNRNSEEIISIPDSLGINKELSGVADDTIFESNPKLIKLEKQKESFEAQRLLAKKEGYPMIGLGVDYSIIGKRDVPNLDMNGQDAIMPMISLTLPIYRKKYKASQKEAELMAESVENEKEAVKNTLYSEYKLAEYDYKKAEQLIKLYQKQTETTHQAIKLLLVGLSNNTSDFEEILSMNQNLLLYQTATITQTKNEFVAQSKIEYLLSKAE